MVARLAHLRGHGGRPWHPAPHRRQPGRAAVRSPRRALALIVDAIVSHTLVMLFFGSLSLIREIGGISTGLQWDNRIKYILIPVSGVLSLVFLALVRLRDGRSWFSLQPLRRWPSAPAFYGVTLAGAAPFPDASPSLIPLSLAFLASLSIGAPIGVLPCVVRRLPGHMGRRPAAGRRRGPHHGRRRQSVRAPRHPVFPHRGLPDEFRRPRHSPDRLRPGQCVGRSFSWWPGAGQRFSQRHARRHLRPRPAPMQPAPRKSSSPKMIRRGYSPPFACAVTAVAPLDPAKLLTPRHPFRCWSMLPSPRSRLRNCSPPASFRAC